MRCQARRAARGARNVISGGPSGALRGAARGAARNQQGEGRRRFEARCCAPGGLGRCDSRRTARNQRGRRGRGRRAAELRGYEPRAARRALPPHGAPVPRPPLFTLYAPRTSRHTYAPNPRTSTTFISSAYMAAGGTRRSSRSRSSRLAYPCTCPSELRAALIRFSHRAGKYGFVLVTEFGGILTP